MGLDRNGRIVIDGGTPLPFGVSIPQVLQMTTTVATANNTTASETDLLVGATAKPDAIASLNSHSGFLVKANTLSTGKAMRLTCSGNYTTNGATATITPSVRITQSGISVTPGVGVASGTFASGAGPLAWRMQIELLMLDATHMMASGGLFILGNETQATTVAQNGSLVGAVAGVVVDLTLDMRICPTWTGSSNNAGNTFQLQFATLELLN